MPKITTDLAGGEAEATFRTRVNAIIAYWTGASIPGGSTYATVRGLFNGLNGPQIANNEVASSFFAKINTMNDVDQAIRAVAFGHGETGVWLDAGDAATLFRDVAGTLPVTTVGQGVALWKDRSGGTSDFQKAATAQQPTYQTPGGVPALRFDGVDDCLSALTYRIDTADEITVVVAATKTSEAAIGRLFSNNSNGTNAGGLSVNWPGTAAALTAGIGSSNVGTTVTTGAGPVSKVLVATAKISAPYSAIYMNGVLGSESFSAQLASATYASGQVHVGAQTAVGANGFTGDIYGVLATSRRMSAVEIVMMSQMMRLKYSLY